MAVDPVHSVHASAAAQNIEAVENAQRNPNPQSSPPAVPRDAVPKDRVTISPAAKAEQAASVRDHQGNASHK
jgi:hypothetical protein